MRKHNQVKAFTLIEVLFYVAMVSVFTLVVASFWGSVNEIDGRNKAMSVVNTEAAFILNKISREIRTATTINTPAIGNALSSLSIAKSTSGVDPTIFTAIDGVLSIQQGSAAAVQLSSNQIYVNNIVFTNISNVGTAGAVRIELELAYVNTSGKPVLDYSQTYYDTISIRN